MQANQDFETRGGQMKPAINGLTVAPGCVRASNVLWKRPQPSSDRYTAS